MPRDKSDVEGGLVRKGFQPIKPGADHNYFIYLSLAGKKARASTKTSHGKSFDIDDHGAVADALLAVAAAYFGIWGDNTEESRKTVFGNYRKLLERAVFVGEPVSFYGWRIDLRNILPAGWVRKGDLLVKET